MPFKDTPEGQTHFQNDGCGEPEHNDDEKTLRERLARLELLIEVLNEDMGAFGAVSEDYERLAAYQKEKVKIQSLISPPTHD